ncbi:exonuclease SbcD [Escherichia coli]|uniref:Nuclease SbcCD subunit D n=1 Tax=Escherichia coli TaxID=562 RepID=A0A377DWI0_ECOLX|nr:exonuclease SbcD [Escherichia coli]
MRILHTSDWHLGQNFYSKSREAEHQAFLDWLLETAQTHQVDAIIVAGDVFDTGSPPSYARTLYNRFVVNLQQTGCHLVVLAGNHDSVATLNESRDIMAFPQYYRGRQRRTCAANLASSRRDARRSAVPHSVFTSA